MARITHDQVSGYLRARMPFKSSNLHGEWVNDDVYAVFSYKTYPIVAYSRDRVQGYVVAAPPTRSTHRHVGMMFGGGFGEMLRVSVDQLEELIYHGRTPLSVLQEAGFEEGDLVRVTRAGMLRKNTVGTITCLAGVERVYLKVLFGGQTKIGESWLGGWPSYGHTVPIKCIEKVQDNVLG
jgi:hypothetical protein